MKLITKRPGYDDSQPGNFVLYFRGVAISHDGGYERIYGVIHHCPWLSKEDQDNLWGFWAAVDALVGGYEHEYGNPEIWPLGEVLGEMKTPEFQGNDSWDDVLEFVEDNLDDFELTVIVPN